MESECTPRNFRRYELAPIGAYSSDEGELHRPSRSESNSMLENRRRMPIGVLPDPLRGSVKMEIERTPRNFRRSHLAPIGAYSSDDDGLKALLGARASECEKIAGERQSEF